MAASDPVLTARAAYEEAASRIEAEMILAGRVCIPARFAFDRAFERYKLAVLATPHERLDGSARTLQRLLLLDLGV